MTGLPRLPNGITLVRLEEIDSTNEEARRRADAGAPEGTLVWAGSQTGGRGRRGRRWISPVGNCYTSLVLRPTQSPSTAAQISFVTSLALAEAVRDLLPRQRQVSCKWPNDVLIDGAKCAGILLESRMGGDSGLDWLIVGVGINVASHPEGLEYPAVDLHAAGATAGIAEVLQAYMGRFAPWHARWKHDGFGPIREAWLRHADQLGSKVRVHLQDVTLDGIFESLDEAGALVLAGADGTRRHITAGEVFRAA